MSGKNQETVVNRECGYWGKLAVSVAIWANNGKVAHMSLKTVKRQFLWGQVTETGKEREDKHVLIWGGKFQVLGRPVLQEIRTAGSPKWPPEELRDPVRPVLHYSKEYPHADGRREDIHGFGGVGLSGLWRLFNVDTSLELGSQW